MSTYDCCRHCRHRRPSSKGHRVDCHHAGCRGSASPSVWMQFASLLNLFTIR